MFRINQKGGTMVEAIAVISIMTVLGISAIKLIGGLFDGFKQNIVTSEIRELQKNVSARYSGYSSLHIFYQKTTDSPVPEK